MDQDLLTDRNHGGIVSYGDGRSLPREWRAGGFAGGMLLPDGVCRREWPRRGEDWARWREVIEEYHCNFGVLFNSLADLDLMGREVARKLEGSTRWRIGRSRKQDPELQGVSPGHVQRVEEAALAGLPMELLGTAAAALLRGDISWQRAARRLWVEPDTLRSLLAGLLNLKQPLPSQINPAWAWEPPGSARTLAPSNFFM